MLTEPVEPEPEPKTEAAVSPEFAALDWGEVAAITAAPGPPDNPADPGAAAEDGEAVAAKPGKSSRGKKRGAVVAIKEGGAEAADPFAALAELQAMDGGDAPTGGEGSAPALSGALIDPMAAFAAFAAAEGDDEGPARPDGMTDPSAAFAALAEAAEVEAKAVMPKAQPVIDPFAAFAELDAAEDQAAQEIAPKAKPAVIDAGAAFAALDAAREEEARAIAPAAGKPKPLAIDLSAQFAAMGDDD